MYPDKLVDFELEEERREQLEHRDVLLAIGVLLKQKEGLDLFKYLFKSLEVTMVPPDGLEGKPLHEYLGLCKAGNSIYKLVCQADANIAGTLLAKVERERYERQIEQYRIESEFRGKTSESGDELQYR